MAQPSSPGLREVRGAPTGQFDFYVLSLSWAPGFCESEGQARHAPECDDGRKLGFVAHGLWPQFEMGYPAFCSPTERFLTREALDEAKRSFPDERTARYQWRKHGACSGLNATAYFRALNELMDRITIPLALDGPEVQAKALPLEIERAFAEANTGLRPTMMAVKCGRRIFQEMRFCLDKDLRNFRNCPEVDLDGCRAGEVTIHAVH